MTGVRPRVLLPAATEPLRTWLLQSGAEPVTDPGADGLAAVVGAPGPAGSAALPVLDAGASRAEVGAFVRGLRGKASHRADDHGSAESWPRGSYANREF